MTSITILRLLSDGLLLLAISYLAFRVLGRQQPSTIANLTKLKELEVSLKAIVKEADDAGRNLSDDLLSRKKDLEGLLSEVEAAEIRINKSKKNNEEIIENAEAVEKRLGKLTRQYIELIESQEAMLESPRFEQPGGSREPAPAYRQAAENPASFRTENVVTAPLRTGSVASILDYNTIPEPPSFSGVRSAEMRKAARSPTLQSQIEVSYNDSVTYSLNKVAESASKAIQKTAEPFVAQQFPELEKTSNQQEVSGIRQDPRLGVLGTLKKDAQFL